MKIGKSFLNLFDKKMKIELKDYNILNNILYIETKLFVFNNFKLKIMIIKYVYKIFLEEYIDRFFIYSPSLLISCKTVNN